MAGDEYRACYFSFPVRIDPSIVSRASLQSGRPSLGRQLGKRQSARIAVVASSLIPAMFGWLLSRRTCLPRPVAALASYQRRRRLLEQETLTLTGGRPVGYTTWMRASSHAPCTYNMEPCAVEAQPER